MMQTLAEQSLERIQSRQPERHYLGKGMLLPVYDGLSVGNLPASICRWLGCDPGEFLPPLTYEHEYGSCFDHVILVIVDGLGTYQMQFINERLASNPWIQLCPKEAIETRLTSVVPSATAAALTSIWTGASAGQHGLAGYETWLRDLGMVVNFLLYSPVALGRTPGLLADAGIPPEQMFPVGTIGQALSRAGILSRSHMPIMLASSNLTRAQMSGTAVLPYRRFGDLWANLSESLASTRDQRTFDAVYWNDIDTYNHLMGMRDSRVVYDLDQFFAGLAETVLALRKKALGKTLVLLSADHGHIENVPDPHRDLKNHPEIMNNLLILPCGENRLTYFYPKAGKEQTLRAYISAEWPGEFRVATGEELIRDGVYGPNSLHPDLLNRVGELVAIAEDRTYFWWPNRPDRLHARHGGLSQEEMIVPLTGLVL